ncbi:NADP-dependent oxidoreductase [Corynebacterium doosanense]|uniref:Alcohol dehydrogenase n=1 Tax=Corynebacterium doosanense CAU 212 = DSM 45436 TaxID=558173 RepID=A0A097IEZ3_9CORY|nr:NADP-dependent oxidoreductase [Corynebacterium doosanense]AIT60695.1 alcohol dehydrogenase [Corynebacterium doosanense CAU 212 = DSM 45436]
MKSLTFNNYGGPEVYSLESLSIPEPQPGQVRIRVVAAGLNPVDSVQREGGLKMLHPYDFPKVAGNEVSGTIDALGDGVTGFERGENVIARLGKSELGGLAEYVVTEASFVARAPEKASLIDAAGLPLAGLTARQALGTEHLDVQPGDRLLITGAAGGVGLYAIQLAKLQSAEVTVTASPQGEGPVRNAGADHVINYREQKVSEAGRTYNKIFDLVGGDDMNDLFNVIEAGGRVVSIAGPPSPGSLVPMAVPRRRWLVAIVEKLQSRKACSLARKAQASYEYFFMHPDGAELAELSALVDAGKLTLTTDSTYALEEWSKAFEQLESRHSKGKVIVEVA